MAACDCVQSSMADGAAEVKQVLAVLHLCGTRAWACVQTEHAGKWPSMQLCKQDGRLHNVSLGCRLCVGLLLWLH